MLNIIQNINKAFDHRIRLGIMSVLMVNESADFNMLKELLGVTDGNLASHTKALELENYIQIEKERLFLGLIINLLFDLVSLIVLLFHCKIISGLLFLLIAKGSG
jgi:hypothetical protein